MSNPRLSYPVRKESNELSKCSKSQPRGVSLRTTFLNLRPSPKVHQSPSCPFSVSVDTRNPFSLSRLTYGVTHRHPELGSLFEPPCVGLNRMTRGHRCEDRRPRTLTSTQDDGSIDVATGSFGVRLLDSSTHRLHPSQVHDLNATTTSPGPGYLLRCRRTCGIRSPVLHSRHSRFVSTTHTTPLPQTIVPRPLSLPRMQVKPGPGQTRGTGVTNRVDLPYLSRGGRQGSSGRIRRLFKEDRGSLTRTLFLWSQNRSSLVTRTVVFAYSYDHLCLLHVFYSSQSLDVSTLVLHPYPLLLSARKILYRRGDSRSSETFRQ